MDTQYIIELILKVFGLLASVAATYKIISEVVINKKSKLRDEYEFTKKYLIDLFSSQDDELHPFLIEKGYLAISGKNLQSNEIVKLLGFPNPSLSLRNYAASRKYLELSEDTNNFCYTQKYESECKRKWLSRLYFYSYFIFAFIGFFPLFLGSLIGMNFDFQTLVSFLAFMFAFIFLAVIQLISYSQIESAKFVLEQQQKVIDA